MNRMSAMPACLALLLYLGPMPPARALDPPAPLAESLGVDFARPVQIVLEVEVRREGVSLAGLGQYMVQQGFEVAVEVDYEEQGDAAQLRRVALKASRSGPIAPERFDALVDQVAQRARELEASTSWHVSQLPGQG